MEKAGFVAIAGRPNSGKSTLMNRVLGAQISIVTPKAQTTRERVLGIFTQPGQGQLVFVDAPGIHQARGGSINAYMVREAREALEGSSVIWYLVDPHSALVHENAVLEVLPRAGMPVFVLMNKCDLGLRAKESEILESEVLADARTRGIDVRGTYRISAKTGLGLDDLLRDTWAIVPEGQPYYPDAEQLSDRPVRYFVGEKIREQLYLRLGDELPYSCAVEIERFEESSRPPRIEAVIHVERESQKGIVIGKGGAKIKEIGQAARVVIEAFLAQHVFLGLRVKVLKDWTKNADSLRRLGYVLPDKKGFDG
jgi:GTPase